MTFKGRTCLYHADFPKGRIFTDRKEYEQALRTGWVDAPWEVKNREYVPPDLKALLVKVTLPPVEASPSPDEPLKPWQIAQAARKAKRQARQGELNGRSIP